MGVLHVPRLVGCQSCTIHRTRSARAFGAGESHSKQMFLACWWGASRARYTAHARHVHSGRGNRTANSKQRVACSSRVGGLGDRCMWPWIPSQLLVGMLGAARADQRLCMAHEGFFFKRLALHCGIPEQNIGASLLFDFPFPRTPARKRRFWPVGFDSLRSFGKIHKHNV